MEVPLKFKIGDRVEVTSGNYATTVKGSYGYVSGQFRHPEAHARGVSLGYVPEEIRVEFEYIPNCIMTPGMVAFISVGDLKPKPLTKLERALK